ncbi:MAG TPA: S-layer homology domain-containing protein [Thermoanaerobaculia bacterium]|nr:S-layer homology domain-containing protein [Thermoanaerobaculia bacterium]
MVDSGRRAARFALAFALALVWSAVALSTTYTVVNTSDSGAGSLRQAILDANAGGTGPHTVAFAIPGSGVQTIALASSLPGPNVASGGLTVDGTTQPGYAGSPLIAIACSDTSQIAFQFFGSGGGVKGLTIGHCGIAITSDESTSITVQACHIGVDAAGTTATPNFTGVSLAGSTFLIGGPVAADRNIISGNQSDGIFIGSFTGGTIQNNYIGTDVTGTVPLPNATGVVIAGGNGSGVLVGGAGTGNLISANTGDGLDAGFFAVDVTIQGNVIGTDVNGTAAMPNNVGIGISSPGAGLVIGGTGVGEGNLVSGNLTIGMSVNADGATIQGNAVGVDDSHLAPLPNGSHGIEIASTGASPNLIGTSSPGGPGANIIAYNGGQGVAVAAGPNNTIRGNAIHDNAALGITLSSGSSTPTANDLDDGDTGPNDRQDFPVLVSVAYGAGNTTVSGLLNSTPNTTFALDFYSNPACSNFPRDYVQGETYLGSSQVTTDDSGNAPFTVSTLPAVVSGSRISVTATDPTGDTSEFSQRLPFSVSPKSGPAAGGTALTVAGTNFLAGADVKLGGISATGVSVNSYISISAASPALAPGTANDLVVTNTDNTTGTLLKAFVADFLDVPNGQQFYTFVTTLVSNGITAGVGGGLYGVNDDTLRQQMAVFILKGKHGLCFTPAPCHGAFADVPCPSTFADWIEAMAAEGITGGCGGGNFCPQTPVRRDQMAVFLLKGEHGSAYAPPHCAGMFTDVPCPSTYADWIEQLANEGITGGCGGGNYCPANPNTRGQMAAFMVKAFSLQ